MYCPQQRWIAGDPVQKFVQVHLLSPRRGNQLLEPGPSQRARNVSLTDPAGCFLVEDGVRGGGAALLWSAQFQREVRTRDNPTTTSASTRASRRSLRGCSPLGDEMTDTAPTRVVIDCDTGVDDAVTHFEPRGQEVRSHLGGQTRQTEIERGRDASCKH